MKKRLKVYNNCALYDETSCLIMDDEDLALTIDYKLSKGLKLFYLVCCGDKTLRKESINNIIIIPREIITPGRLKLTLQLVANETIVKKIQAEDLIIRENDENIETIPSIANVNQKLDNALERIELLEKRLDFLVNLWRK